MSPLAALTWWGSTHFRLFNVFYFLPEVLFGFFYSVYLVQRFGGTPGKRLMKLRIVKLSGEAVSYREALLRYLPEGLMGIGSSVAGVLAVLSLSDAQYFASTSFLEQSSVIQAAMPGWNGSLTVVLNIWIWSEFLVMLTNEKRRAIHDFIAGTVVIKDPQTAASTELANLDSVGAGRV